MQINLKNVEELIFFDKKLRSILPEFRHLFDQWQLGQRLLGMKSMAQRSVIEFLNSLEEVHIKKLEEYFNDIIVVDTIDHRITADFEGPVSEDIQLCQFSGYKDFCLTRSKDKISISFWR